MYTSGLRVNKALEFSGELLKSEYPLFALGRIISPTVLSY